MSSGYIDTIVAESDDGGDGCQKVVMNNAGVMESWSDTESHDSSSDESDSNSDEIETIGDMMMGSWPDTKVGDSSVIDDSSATDNVIEFSPPEIDEAGVSSNQSASASNLSFWEMGYTRGWGHGKIIWPQQQQSQLM